MKLSSMLSLIWISDKQWVIFLVQIFFKYFMGYIENYSSLIWNSNITVNFVNLVAKSDNLITPEFIWLLFKLLPEGKKKKKSQLSSNLSSPLYPHCHLAKGLPWTKHLHPPKFTCWSHSPSVRWAFWRWLGLVEEMILGSSWGINVLTRRDSLSPQCDDRMKRQLS